VVSIASLVIAAALVAGTWADICSVQLYFSSELNIDVKAGFVANSKSQLC